MIRIANESQADGGSFRQIGNPCDSGDDFSDNMNRTGSYGRIATGMGFDAGGGELKISQALPPVLNAAPGLDSSTCIA